MTDVPDVPKEKADAPEPPRKPSAPATAAAGKSDSPSSGTDDTPELSRVFIRPLPKVVFLWPVAATALVCWITQGMAGGDDSTRLGLAFFVVLTANLPIAAFEFNRIAIVVLALLVALFWALGAYSHVLGFARGLQISASTGFYMWFFVLLAVIYLVVFLKTRFNYWELTSNELLHHHGILGDVERYPAPGLRITKEVNDVFEFLLLASGRLVIQPQSEERALVLDGIFRVNRVENRMKELLSTLQVKVGTPD